MGVRDGLEFGGRSEFVERQASVTTSERIRQMYMHLGERLGPKLAEVLPGLIDGILTALEAIEAEPFSEKPEFAPPPPWGDPAMTPRDAFLGRQEVVPFSEAEGRIAAEPLATYPPGIPNVLPGERLTRETLDYITDSVSHGGYVRGAADRELTTLRVIAE